MFVESMFKKLIGCPPVIRPVCLGHHGQLEFYLFFFVGISGHGKIGISVAQFIPVFFSSLSLF